ncbi:MAG: cobalamin B12-binding domain-containing protein [Pseudomonadota bacterium]
MTKIGSDQPEGGRAREESSGTPTPLGGASPDSDVATLSRSMLSRLSRTIETEIVPRFMLAFESDSRASGAANDLDLGSRVEEFVQIVVDHDAQVAARYIDALRQQGAHLADIYLDLLGPAARYLGVLWEEDDATFADVAIGVCRMHQVLLEFSRCFDPTDNAFGSGRSALIVPTPGEEHTFGLFLVVEFLRRAGWHCWTGSPASIGDLRALVQSQRFDAVGLSLSSNRHVDRTADSIKEIRAYSKNPDAAILLGGSVPNDRPELVSQLGADETATDGRAAVRVLNKLCGVDSGAPARG